MYGGFFLLATVAMETPKICFSWIRGQQLIFGKKTSTYLKDNGICHQDINFQVKVLSRTPDNFSQSQFIKKSHFRKSLLKSRERFYTHSQQNNSRVGSLNINFNISYKNQTSTKIDKKIYIFIKYNHK